MWTFLSADLLFLPSLHAPAGSEVKGSDGEKRTGTWPSDRAHRDVRISCWFVPLSVVQRWGLMHLSCLIASCLAQSKGFTYTAFSVDEEPATWRLNNLPRTMGEGGQAGRAPGPMDSIPCSVGANMESVSSALVSKRSFGPQTCAQRPQLPTQCRPPSADEMPGSAGTWAGAWRQRPRDRLVSEARACGGRASFVTLRC